MTHFNELKEWLAKEPGEQEVITLPSGAKTIPHDIIEDKLDFYTDSRWSTECFEHKYTVVNNAEAISASIVLIVPVGMGTIIKRVGACTYSLQQIRDFTGTGYETGIFNDHFAATAKSLCIVNAAKSLGNTFGKSLNRPEIAITVDLPY